MSAYYSICYSSLCTLKNVQLIHVAYMRVYIFCEKKKSPCENAANYFLTSSDLVIHFDMNLQYKMKHLQMADRSIRVRVFL